MGTASIHFDGVSLAWRSFWRSLRLEPAGRHDCIHAQSLWRRLARPNSGVLLEGGRYCVERCMERALFDALRRLASSSRRAQVAHRVPLGLLLLSRQQLTPGQLRIALEAQRHAGRGRLGEWLLSLGFVNEQQITAALARQWSCPVLRVHPSPLRGAHPAQIPATLLERFVMIPVEYVEASKTLHVAFAEGIDYSVLYAIERMTGCRTQPCMAVPSLVRANLQARSSQHREHELAFECLTDVTEFARIIRSYCVRVAASEVRLAACGCHTWARLLRPQRPPLDLLLCPPQASSSATSLAHASA